MQDQSHHQEEFFEQLATQLRPGQNSVMKLESTSPVPEQVPGQVLVLALVPLQQVQVQREQRLGHRQRRFHQ
jgi:hypothetical protein